MSTICLVSSWMIITLADGNYKFSCTCWRKLFACYISHTVLWLNKYKTHTHNFFLPKLNHTSLKKNYFVSRTAFYLTLTSKHAWFKYWGPFIFCFPGIPISYFLYQEQSITHCKNVGFTFVFSSHSTALSLTWRWP